MSPGDLRRPAACIVLVLAVAAGAWSSAFATSTGRTGASTSPGCNSCHSGGATPSVTISGPTSLQTGSTGSYTLTISGGAKVTGGLDVSANGGSLIASGSGTKLVSGEVTHTTDKAFSGNSVSWSFQWRAPSSAGTFTLFGAGNSTNNNSSTSGDRANFDTHAVSVTIPPKLLTVVRAGSGSGTVTSSPGGINCPNDCSQSYAHNTVVTLSAAAAAGSQFTGWSACAGTGTCTVTMSAAKTVTATFEALRLLTVDRTGTGTGTVTSVPGGISCGADCTQSYLNNTSVTLSAAPSADSAFTGWSACAGTSTCQIAMTADRTVTATFSRRTLAVAVSGQGSVISSPAGIVCPGTCSALFDNNEVVDLTPSPSAGLVFRGWSGACTESTIPCRVTMDRDQNVSATFARPTLSVTVTGQGTVTSSAGGISCPDACSAAFDAGDTVSLTVLAEQGFEFSAFAGDCSGASCALTMSADRSVTAIFAPSPTTESVTIAPDRDTSICEPDLANGRGALFVGPSFFGTEARALVHFDLGALPANALVVGATLELTLAAAGSHVGEIALHHVQQDWGEGGSLGNAPGAPCATPTVGDASWLSAFFGSVAWTAGGNFDPTPSDAQTTSGLGPVRWSSPQMSTDVQGWIDDAGTNFGWLLAADASSAGRCFVSKDTACPAGGDPLAVPQLTVLFQRTFALMVNVTASNGATGTVSTIPAGIADCAASCTARFINGQQVSFTPQPGPGSVFAGWTGACAGNGACAVDVSADATVGARFVRLHQLTVTRQGNGGVTSVPAGIDCGSDCGEDYAEGTAVTLTAAPAAGSRFTGWSDPGCPGQGQCVVTMSTPRSVTATFKIERRLTVVRDGAGSGQITSAPAGISCGQDCDEIYLDGDAVTLTAQADAGSAFAGWSACAGTSTCQISMTADRTVTATFQRAPRTLSVRKAGPGSGTVTSSPAGIGCGTDCEEAYLHGDTVTLSAAAAAGSTFTGFSGGGCSGTGACPVLMTASRTVTATFDLVPRTLTVVKAGTGAGTVTSTPAGIGCGASCSAQFPNGTAVDLSAQAATGSTFVGFGGGGCSGTGPCQVTMDAARTVTATFRADAIENLTFNVSVRDNFFDAADLTIAQGDTVTWVWSAGSGVSHNTTSNASCGSRPCNQGNTWASEETRTSGTFSHTFEALGSFPYNCTLHPGMIGTVTVEPVLAIPDLVVESQAVDDATLILGQAYALNATVRNRGRVAAGGTTLRYFVSADSTITIADTAIGTPDAIGALGANETSAQSTTLTAASLGTFFLGACVDPVAGEGGSGPAGLSGAASTANQCSAGVQITVSEPPPRPEQTLTFTAVRDATICEDLNDPDAGASNGRGGIFVGRNAVAGSFASERRRGLVRFDLSAIPAGSVISSASLALTVGRAANPPSAVTVHKALKNWGEGTSAAPGSCAVATPGDASWRDACTAPGSGQCSAQAWAAPGGDFTATASASATSGQTGSATTWSAARMAADVQSWVDNQTVNFGWLLRGNEASPQTARCFISKDSSCPDISVVAGAPPQLTVTFVPASGTPSLGVAVVGSGTGTVTSSPAGISCGADCEQTYATGTTVTLSAAPGAGSRFDGWGGGGCAGTGTCVVTLLASSTVTATFTATAKRLSVVPFGTGSGTVTSSPAGIDCGADCTQSYPEGTVVTLTATPAPGSLFSGWAGACVNLSGPCTVQLGEDNTAAPLFDRNPAVLLPVLQMLLD